MSSTVVSLLPAPATAPTAAAVASAADNSGAPSYEQGKIIVALKLEGDQVVPVASVYGAPFFSFPAIPLSKLATGPQGAASFVIRNSWPHRIDKHGNKEYFRPSGPASASISLPPGCAPVPPRGSFLDRVMSIARSKK